MKKVVISVAVLVLISPLVSAQIDDSALFPEVEPLQTGHLRVSELHEIYWEACGNPEGIPVLVLHGGPGGGVSPIYRRFFDPERFYIILHEQRGSGRSKPYAEWRENTTQHLLEDINRLRKHLGIEGKAILWGGSWGATLAVACAETYPELVSGLVLRGVFLGSKDEIERYYHGGTYLFYPETYERLKQVIPDPDSLDYPRQLFEMIQGRDREARDKAIKEWAFYEIRISSPAMTDEWAEQIIRDIDLTAFSVLENYYMMNDCFLDDDQLLREADKIAHIPTFIVNGRFDTICPPKTAYALAKKLKNVKLEIAEYSGHSMYDPPIMRALAQGVEWVAEQVQ